MNCIVPVFFRVNDDSASFLIVAIGSIKAHTDLNYVYHFIVLSDNLSEENRSKLLALQEERIQISFSPAVSSVLDIAEHFPGYDKAICLDPEIVVTGDLASLWSEPLGGKLVGAVAESPARRRHLLRRLGTLMHREYLDYMNTGVLLLNCKRLREEGLAQKYAALGEMGGNETEQDRLNELCRGRILFLDPNWNADAGEKMEFPDDDPRIIHFRPGLQPWQYEALLAAAWR